MLEQFQSKIAVAEVDIDVKEFLADAGYVTESNTKAVTAKGMNPIIATQRLKENEQISAAKLNGIQSHYTS